MGASREVPHKGTHREVNRIAVRGAVVCIAEYRDLIRRRYQEEAVRRRHRRGPHNLAHKTRRESQPFRQRHK
jgi:hypothetical protein